MDTGKLISTLALIGSVATAVAVPLADIKPVYGIVAGLGAAVVGAIGKGLIDVKGTSLLTALGVIVAVSAAIVNFADVQTILSPQVLSVITHVGAIAAALGKGLMGGSDDPPVGGAGGGTKSAFALVLLCLILLVSQSACARRDGDAAYRKAFYTAHAVYDLDALGDLFQIFEKGGIITPQGADKAYQLTDEALIVVDETGHLLEQGLPANTFDRTRVIIGAIKQAVASGAIKFKSQKAQDVYANSIATIEVTVNLIEAINAGRKNEIERLEKEQKASAAKTKASIAQADPTWYQDAIVRGSLLASELTVLSNAETPAIWAALKQRSAETHAENRLRLGN